jgi:hypothetical protein
VDDEALQLWALDHESRRGPPAMIVTQDTPHRRQIETGELPEL